MRVITLGRAGLSLAEVAVVIALLGVVGGAIVSAILHQQRFSADANELLRVREGVRDAMEVLSTDIRGSSQADTIRLMADSAIEFFASVGTSVVCRAISSNAVALAEESLGGHTLSGFVVHPDSGDIALLYVGSTDTSEPRWNRYRIAAFAARPEAASCLPETSGSKEGFVLTLQSAIADTVRAGTPVRLVRRGRYSLYRSSDREWYLGYRRCNAVGPSSCGSIQPVSGPYRGYNSDAAETGFLFEYFDARGERVTGADAPSVVRIDVTARAQRPRRRTIGSGQRFIGDSGSTSIAIRNR